MKKLKLTTLSLAAFLAASTAAQAQIACAGGLIVMGIYTSITEKRELTQKEANWCGFYREDVKKDAKKPKKMKAAKKTS